MSSAASRGARRPAGWTAAAPPGPAPGARGPPRGASDADHRGPPALPSGWRRGRPCWARWSRRCQQGPRFQAPRFTGGIWDWQGRSAPPTSWRWASTSPIPAGAPRGWPDRSGREGRLARGGLRVSATGTGWRLAGRARSGAEVDGADVQVGDALSGGPEMARGRRGRQAACPRGAIPTGGARRPPAVQEGYRRRGALLEASAAGWRSRYSAAAATSRRNWSRPAGTSGPR